MNKRVGGWTGLVLWALLAFYAFASGVYADVNGGWLYRVEVAVDNQSGEARREAGRLALETVLRRVTGLARIEALPEIETALANSERYYQQFFYARRLVDGENITLLNIRFDAAQVAKLVRIAGLPVWSANRPNVIAWVVVEKMNSGTPGYKGISREILGADQADALVVELKKVAIARGLPLIFPTMDLTDQVEVSTGVVWGQLSSELLRASRRYEVDALLMGRITETPLGYRSQWSFARKDTARPYASEASQYGDLATGVVDFVTNELAQRYAVLSGQGGLLRFAVHNIAGLAAYSGVLAYLGDLEFVDSVQVEQVERDALVIAIQTNSSWSQFSDLLALDGVLQPLEKQAVYYAEQPKTLVWKGKRP